MRNIQENNFLEFMELITRGERSWSEFFERLMDAKELPKFKKCKQNCLLQLVGWIYIEETFMQQYANREMYDSKGKGNEICKLLALTVGTVT